MQTVKYVVQTDGPRKILPVFSYFEYINKVNRMKSNNVDYLIRI